MTRFAFLILTLTIVTLTGCDQPTSTGRALPTMDIQLTALPSTSPQQARRVRWVREIPLGKSVLGKPIDMVLIEPDPSEKTAWNSDVVLIFGGFHGSEPLGVSVVEKLLQKLLLQPELTAGNTVAIVTCVNPDGLAKKTRTNARGVDINRNFPASNFKPSKAYGLKPLSEPESAAVAKAVAMLKPTRILSAHSTATKRHGNNFDGPAGDLAKALSAKNNYPVLPSWGAPTPGSFGTYAGVDRHIPIITLEIPNTHSRVKAWRDNEPALIEFIQYSQGK